MKPCYKSPTPIDQAEIIPLPTFTGSAYTACDTVAALEVFYNKVRHPGPSDVHEIALKGRMVENTKVEEVGYGR